VSQRVVRNIAQTKVIADGNMMRAGVPLLRATQILKVCAADPDGVRTLIKTRHLRHLDHISVVLHDSAMITAQ
jgi:FKBP-type peptidyl-prolyl cis-trans isomerase 2